jgi:hypothetical protein
MVDGKGTGSELSVRTESIQWLYSLYIGNKFRVNRRYQRKLVWGVEEKQRLIDSIIKDLPIPLFLVAEIGPPGDISYELIDGMQRLNAIFSYLENEFSVGDEYFNLDALADTKLLKDTDQLSQRTPVSPRKLSAQLANYAVALSVYRTANSASIDEVFRRINSGGRRLSRQELRQAGTTSRLADLVRVISSRIRGDTSPGDTVDLKIMPQLSITNRELPYGVLVDDIFWVRNGILRREELRASADEQAVLDILIDCLIDPPPNSGTRIRDSYYSFIDIGDDKDEPTRESIVIERAIDSFGHEKLEHDFMRTYDTLREILAQQDRRFSALIEAGSGGRSPRYFHAVFMAVFELLFRDHMRVRDYSDAATRLAGVGTGSLRIPAGGGDWQKDAKRQSVDAVKGVLRPTFEETSGPEDFGRYGWASQLETILGNALVEQQLFDCKQGFLSLYSSRDFDSGNFRKICRTLTAMANGGPGIGGYVAVGIADNESDSRRVQELDGIRPLHFRHFRIVGIEREASLRQLSLNDYWAWLMQKLISMNEMEKHLARNIATESRLVNYQGRVVALLKVKGQREPAFFGGAMVERSGSETVEVAKSDYMRVFSRFLQPQQ